ncbi:MAG TPA: hypothetical protein VGR08_09395 [Thermomicrobiales bacterium]|nr:hypothetical protein [Thermomicrobiales bacterium]
MPDPAPQHPGDVLPKDTEDESNSTRKGEHSSPGKEPEGEDASAQAERELDRQLDSGEENPA